MDVEAARRRARLQIQRNPTDIWIQRKSVVDDGAGGVLAQETVALSVQTVRIFSPIVRTQTKQVSSEAGQFQVQTWGLLAEWDADIQPDDRFSAMGRNFRVIETVPKHAGGGVVSLEVDLGEVS